MKLGAGKCNNYMVDKVKRSFMRMISPGEFGTMPPRSFRNIRLMNLPAEMGGRDAAYRSAVQILDGLDFTLPEKERRNLYMTAEACLEIAVEKTELIYAAGFREKKQIEPPELLKYMKLLRQLTGTLGDVCEYEQLSSNPEYALLMNETLSLSSGDIGEMEFFFHSEKRYYDILLKMIKTADLFYLKCRESDKKLFSKSDLDRYEKAFSENMSVYSKTAVLTAAKEIPENL